MKNKVLRDMLIPGCVAVAAIFVPYLLISVGVIDAYTAQIITLGGINAIMAISVNVICGITGQLSLGQAGFMAIGSYTTIILTQTAGMPLPVSIIIAALVTVIFGILIGFPTLKLQGDYLAIVTLGFGEIIRVVLVNLKDWWCQWIAFYNNLCSTSRLCLSCSYWDVGPCNCIVAEFCSFYLWKSHTSSKRG